MSVYMTQLAVVRHVPADEQQSSRPSLPVTGTRGDAIIGRETIAVHRHPLRPRFDSAAPASIPTQRPLPPMLDSLTDKDDEPSALTDPATFARLVLFIVLPTYVFWQFTVDGMLFRAVVVTMLTILVVGVGVMSMDLLSVIASIDDPDNDSE